MTDIEPRALPPGHSPDPPPSDPTRFDTLEFRPPAPQPSRMRRVLKGRLIAVSIAGAVIFLLVSACFTLVAWH
jgi:hypothetical protein